MTASRRRDMSKISDVCDTCIDVYLDVLAVGSGGYRGGRGECICFIWSATSAEKYWETANIV